jgi:hypothetical protein
LRFIQVVTNPLKMEETRASSKEKEKVRVKLPLWTFLLLNLSLLRAIVLEVLALSPVK